jgi:beta-lactamase superfamily II metal-dependent hydrolase
MPSSSRNLVRLLVSALFGALMIFSLACQPEAPKQPEPEPAPLRGDGRLNIYALDVGQGDSLLVISPGGKTVLIDAGPPGAGNEVVAALNQRGVKILDLVVATHPHADHIGGMRQVMQNFKVRKFLDSGQTHSSETYERMLGEIQERKISFIKARRGQNIEIEPNVRLEVLNPGKEFFTQVRSGGSVLNANSIVLRLSYDDFAMLFTGDAEFETEALMMDADATLKAQVLKIGHHGSRHATSGKFLAAVAPKAAVISDGETNDYGHPSQFTLDRLRRARVQTYRTDLHGEIAIVTDGKAFEIKPSRKASLTAVWLGRQPAQHELTASP